MLIFQDSKIRYSFGFRSRVRCSRGRCKGVVVCETGFSFHVARQGHTVFSVFWKQSGCCTTCAEPVTDSHSKSIDVWHQFLRELLRQRDIKVVQIPSEFQHANTLSKALAYDLFALYQKLLFNLKKLFC